jgi:Ser-tRNA(Ala) deacylase AlaX
LSIQPFEGLPESDQSLIKPGSINPPPTHALIFESTIFHPQGGGQPSDTGKITIPLGPDGDDKSAFEVSMVRHSLSTPSVVLHFGHFLQPNHSLGEGTTVTQKIDEAKRLLYSRCHTAGHVLGAAVRHLLEHKIDGFDELKASHFPDSAACEFQGLIYGDQKSPIQTKLDEYVKAHMPVEVDFWSKEDFKLAGLERLLPSNDDWESLAEPEGEGRVGKIRVVNIVGAEVYPCGGTHVDFSDECGKVTVRKIGRTKGTSRVSYAVD